MNPRYIQILDSRGNPTIQGTYTHGQAALRCAVPSGASTGVHEAVELRDGEDAFGGKSVYQAVRNAQQLSGQLDWAHADVQQADTFMLEQDGTKNKRLLGANALLAVSLLQARVQAHQREAEVYELIGRGMTTREIAEAMMISPKTVDSHRGRIKTKLGAESTTELARQAALYVQQEI